MNEVVPGHFYLHKWEGSISENTFYSTKNLALSDRIFLKSNMRFLSNYRGQKLINFVNFEKKVFNIVIAT